MWPGPGVPLATGSADSESRIRPAGRWPGWAGQGSPGWGRRGLLRRHGTDSLFPWAWWAAEPGPPAPGFKFKPWARARWARSFSLRLIMICRGGGTGSPPPGGWAWESRRRRCRRGRHVPAGAARRRLRQVAHLAGPSESESFRPGCTVTAWSSDSELPSDSPCFPVDADVFSIFSNRCANATRVRVVVCSPVFCRNTQTVVKMFFFSGHKLISRFFPSPPLLTCTLQHFGCS